MQAWPEGVGRRVLASVDSTMAECARIAPDLAAPEWVLAHEQTASHGRRGRAWRAPQGNFMASLVMRPEGGAELRALRSFVAALALREAVIAATGREAGIALKWPNDVLLKGGKLAGILLESHGDHLVIGFGVNLIAAPKPTDVEPNATPPVSLLGETGQRLTPEAFLDLLAPAYHRFETMLTTYGFAPIRSAWLSHAARLGETITARTMRETHEGRFEGIDAGGSLVLATAKGPLTLPAAEIYF